MTLHTLPLGLLPMRHHTTPALLAIPFLHLLTRPESPFRHAHHQTALKHERAAARAHLDRRELCLPRALVALCIRSVTAHDIVQTRAAGHEPARTTLLRIVPAADEAHELAHGVAVVPRRAEGVLAHQPSGGEDDKVGNRRARDGARRGEDGEDGGVRVVKRDGANGVEAAEVVLVRVVVALPPNHVKRRVRLRGLEQSVVELHRHGVVTAATTGSACRSRRAKVLGKVRHGGLEITGVGEAVGANGAELGELEMALVQLQRVAPRRTRRGCKMHLVFHAARDHGNLHGAHEQPAHLGANVQVPLLRDDEHVAVGRVKGRLGAHALAGSVDVDAQAGLHGGVAGTSHQAQTGHEIEVVGLVVVKGIPAQLVGDVVQLADAAVQAVGRGLRLCCGCVRRVCARGQDAVEPGLLVLVSGRGEGGAGELLGVEAVGWLLRVVVAYGECAFDGF